MFSAAKFISKHISRNNHQEKSKCDIESLAESSFFDRVNFEVPKGDIQKPFIFWRYLFRTIRQVKFIRNGWKNAELTTIHYHHSGKTITAFADYIRNNLGNNKIEFESVDKDQLINRMGWRYSIEALINVVFLIPFAFNVYRNASQDEKQNVLQVFELGLVLTAFKAASKYTTFDTLLYSSIYHPVSNLIFIYLKDFGKKVNGFVSGTPLYRFLRTIVCDNLYLSNPYQQEEVVFFNQTIQIDRFYLLPPISHEYLLRAKSIFPINSSSKYDIGIYTSAIWKRKESGMYFEEKIEENEKLIFSSLAKGYEKHQYSVKVYLHPREKGTQHDFENAMAYYKNLAAGLPLEFSTKEESTLDCFYEHDIAVMMLSNTIFERLALGFKALAIPIEKSREFPVPDSSLNHICCYEQHEVIASIERIMTMTENEYFDAFSLKKYKLPEV